MMPDDTQAGPITASEDNVVVSRRGFIGTSTWLTLGARAGIAPPRRYRLLLNSGVSGPQAYMLLADDRGYLATRNVAIDFVAGDGAAAIVPRIGREGFDFGYGDLGALIDLAATTPNAAPVAVYVAFNQTPLTIAVSAAGPIRSPRDLEGKTLLGHPVDAALVMFPAYAHAVGLDPTRVTIERASTSMRSLNERMLQGEVAGVFGFVNTILAAVAPAGITRSSFRFLEYRDALPDLCGNALMVRRSLLRERPEDVRAVVQAFNHGLADTVRDLDGAIDAVAKRDSTIRRDVDRARLVGTLRLEMNHPDVARLGVGDVDDLRLQRGITAVLAAKRYPHRPTVRDIFVRDALPPAAERVRLLSTTVRVLLNSGMTGANAWIALAEDRGYLREARVALEFVPGVGAYTAAPRLADEGFDIAYGDINSLIDVVATTPRRAPVGVFAVFSRSPSTIAVLSSSSIHAPKDLEHQVIIGHPTDVALRTFGAYASATGIDQATVNVRPSTLAMRDLVQEMRDGNAAAMFGYLTTITAAARSMGLDPARDLRFLPYRDVVPDLYGSTVMVSQGMLRYRSDIVRAVLTGFARGIVDTVRDPDAAIASLKQRDAGADAAIERERLMGTLAGDMAIGEPPTMIGDVSDARLTRAIALVARTNHLPRVPSNSDVFTRAMLPDVKIRRLTSRTHDDT